MSGHHLTSIEAERRVRSRDDYLAKLSTKAWGMYYILFSRELSRAGGTKGSTTAETRQDRATKREVRVAS